MIDVRRRTVTFGLAAALAMPQRPAWAESGKVTVILTNDIYQMAETLMADGKARGGFARLAAVVKAERARGGHVLFAHGGDTLSPSLMSGLDRGAHIIALTNLITMDIFAPGNHEFDFGKAVFFQRMREANFPLYAANLRGPDGRPLPGFKDRAILTFDGVRIGVTGATHDDTPRTSTSEDLKFLPTVDTMKMQAEALRQEGADFVLAVMHADREQALALQTVDAVEEREGRRAATWWPQFRVIDTATVTPDPAVAALVAKFQAELTREMDVALGTTAVELDSRNAT